MYGDSPAERHQASCHEQLGPQAHRNGRMCRHLRTETDRLQKRFIDRYERESDSYGVVSRLLSWSWALSGWSRDPGPTLRRCCTAATYLNREGKTLIRRTAMR